MGTHLIKLPELSKCLIIGRLNRFVVKVSYKGEEVRAYINNTGRLKELLIKGRLGYCIPSSGSKTDVRLVGVDAYGGGALIDTRLQEESFRAAVSKGVIPWLRGCGVVRRGPKLGSSVLDYLLKCPWGELYVELKSAVLRGPGGLAMYPDCRTLRGERHLKEITEAVKAGVRGAVIFIAGFPGAKGFTPYDEGDPSIRKLLKEAVKAGVKVKAIGMELLPQESTTYLYSPELPVSL